jgi:hypothetical protein
MKTVSILFIALVVFIPFTSVHSDIVEEVPDYAQFTRNPHYHILVVTIQEIKDSITVNEWPPSGRLQVEYVIRGRVVTPGVYRFRISPPMSGIDIEKATRKPKNEWLERQYIGPQKGDKVIISVYTTRDAIKKSNELVIQGPIYRFTEENRERVIAQLAPPERTIMIQLPLFFLILFFPGASVVCSVIARRKNIPDRKKQRFRIIAILLPLLSLILYIYYEAGISLYSNIRIDLLILWPAMLVNGVLVIMYSIDMFFWIKKRKIS